MTGFNDSITLGDSFDIEKVTSSKLIDINSYPVKNVIDILLQDKTTKKNIIWATDSYDFKENKNKNQIKYDDFYTGVPVKLNPRTKKDEESKQKRTKDKAEVFTPLWICNKMNNHCDFEWFGLDVFNVVNSKGKWSPIIQKIQFTRDNWKQYVDSRRLEITCGEAPFITSRYDVSTGQLIYPLSKRVGIIDRKLRVVNENTDSFDDWVKWTIRSFQSCYGYEWQGDNLLIARINLLMTFHDYYVEKWCDNPPDKLLRQIANIISWNFWQMDGLKDTIPFGKPYQQQRQLTLFDSFETHKYELDESNLPCRIYDWRRDNSLIYLKIKKVGNMGKKLFDYVVGNPPYQESQDATSDTPIYNFFMDSAYEISDHVELITPGRFLFDAGKTPKAWNEKMLKDPHIKVLDYIQDSSKVFPGTDIKGGVAITYRDSKKELGPIGAFTAFPELNSILKKVYSSNFDSFSNLVYAPESFKFTNSMIKNHPDVVFKDDGKGGNLGLLSKGHDYDIVTNIFDKLSDIVFFEKKPDDGKTYIKFVGRKNNSRCEMYILRDYVNSPPNLEKYKVILPKSNGSGALGEVLSTPLVGEPLVGEPLVGHTQTFLSIGCFDTEIEAANAMSYIKSKFARVMLGIKKVTQDNKKKTWEYVPNQNFSSVSDIDWSKSIHDIDLQLYQKYGLNNDEIEFIESHVQEMS